MKPVIAYNKELAMNDLERLAWEYHSQCEAFDQSVCKENRDGIAIPTSGKEAALVNKNAHEVFRELERQAVLLGHTSKNLHNAIQDAARVVARHGYAAITQYENRYREAKK